ncbi:lytic polysaccharide monooxygenase [Enterovibrio nigricans]|uniref:Chitin-binding protein n=1 Tax=Enterovibrio nigricans DSM 22720 TaxID=1121868 RepID=A0A1T4VNW7_9GAMM|nr:lytic polysaccharide monooxygenase [Enterovibrio nigricans]PKF49601.1 spindolin [Enterovibrio nigricans]SKA66211.1 chitin-binding protein [Enterovibrio nigricans DSM 22720]
MSRTRLLPYVAVASAISSVAITGNASAHGYMDYPPARQEICYSDGGYWDSSDGSTIPNAACRDAYLESGWYPFVQKSEFAKLVSDYTNQAAVELAVPDGSLCSGADPKKSGMNIPSSEWQSTPIDPSLNGKMTLLYHAATPHNPSFWKIYLSNSSFNPAVDSLKWTDLNLIAEFGNLPVVEINGIKYYQMAITLPTDRTGDAILFSRWQREDPAGEGFYNCSDISFGGDVIPPTWNNIGNLVKSTTDAKAGDTVWFRLFDANGSETLFEKLPIDANNDVESIWTTQLAEIINTSTIAQAGKETADGSITWDSSDIYANAVFAKDKNSTFQLEVKSVPSNSAPTLNAPTSVSVESGKEVTIALSASDADNDALTFTASSGSLSVTGNNASLVYVAPSSTTDITDQILVSVNDGTATTSATITVTIKGAGAVGETNWSADTVYLGGDKVTHLGTTYTAQWWTKGEEPGTSSVWVADKAPNDTEWSTNATYSSGDTATYKGKTYTAKWWTKGDVPTNGGPWHAVL